MFPSLGQAFELPSQTSGASQPFAEDEAPRQSPVTEAATGVQRYQEFAGAIPAVSVPTSFEREPSAFLMPTVPAVPVACIAP
jgi:hypothetical protein